MSRTLRDHKGIEYPEKTRKKLKDKKFFGYGEDNWARLGGKDGKKRSYGHFSGMSALYPKHMVKRKKEVQLNDMLNS
jgi:hypothetical protein